MFGREITTTIRLFPIGSHPINGSRNCRIIVPVGLSRIIFAGLPGQPSKNREIASQIDRIFRLAFARGTSFVPGLSGCAVREMEQLPGECPVERKLIWIQFCHALIQHFGPEAVPLIVAAVRGIRCVE
jgi:hypothetical protein